MNVMAALTRDDCLARMQGELEATERAHREGRFTDAAGHVREARRWFNASRDHADDAPPRDVSALVAERFGPTHTVVWS